MFSSRYSKHLRLHAQLLTLPVQVGAIPTSEAISHLNTGGCVKDTGTVPFGVSAAGGFQLIYDPSIGESRPWYINDHTFVKDATDGTWHVYGITHANPADPLGEHAFAHATAPDLYGPWTKKPFAMKVNPSYGETHLWAPYVLNVDNTYHMFYSGGGNDSTAYEINMATSTDLYHWTRSPTGPLFRDGYQARDPFVVRIGNKWVMYYCGTSNPSGGHHVVLYRTSDDLLNWSERQVAFTDPTTGTWGGNTESPYVREHLGHWYLFIGPRPTQQVYVGTDVFVSDNPFHFDVSDRVGHINSHGVEVVSDGPMDYVSHCGWGQGGLFLAPLVWPAWSDMLRCPATTQLFETY